MWVRALNHDTAFELGDASIRVLVDPWLSPSQTDGVAWFSRQHHVLPWTDVARLEPPDLVVVAFPFTDHCDRATLTRLPREVPVAASPAAARAIDRWGHFRSVTSLPDGVDVEVAGVGLRYLAPTRALDLVHAAVALRLPSGATALYAPHGLHGDDPRLEGCPASTLLTTPIRYALPAARGGVVNLGDAHAARVAARIGARALVPCHHEPKRAEGLVARLARVDAEGWRERLGAALPAGCALVEAPHDLVVRLSEAEP